MCLCGLREREGGGGRREGERETETDTQTDRQTERGGERERDRQRQTDRQRQREIETLLYKDCCSLDSVKNLSNN